MRIESHDYVASPAEIADLTISLLAADSTSLANRATYLKVLVGTSQAALPRGTATKEAMLVAFEQTHAQFMDAVTKAANDTLAPRTPNRAGTLNRMTNFARSSASALRSWIRAGGNLQGLKPRHVTKASLAVQRRPRPLSEGRLKARVEAQSKALVASLLALGETNHSTAAEELDLLMTQLTDQLGAITGGISPRAAQRFQAARTQVISKAEAARALQS